MGALRNSKGKISKTKAGSILLGVAGTIGAAAQVPGVPVTIVPYLNVAAIIIGAIGTALGGIGIRNALERPRRNRTKVAA